MPLINLSETNTNSFNVGSAQVDRMYLGGVLVYERDSQEVDPGPIVQNGLESSAGGITVLSLAQPPDSLTVVTSNGGVTVQSV